MAGENIQLAQNTDADPAFDTLDMGMNGGLESLSGDDALLLDTMPEPVAAAEAAEAEITNPYGLAELWAQGDWVAKGTLITLLLMSVFSWFIIFVRVWDQSRLLKQARNANRDFWTGNTLNEGLEKLQGKDNPFRAVAENGIRASRNQDSKLTENVPIADWVSQNLQRSVDRVNNDLQGGLSFLASVGSTAPFVGLFGTVWGIYHALVAIGVAGQASIDKVAGPVGEALIMTAIGLAVAVPAVLGYNWLLRRNKTIMDQVRYFTNDLYSALISSGIQKK